MNVKKKKQQYYKYSKDYLKIQVNIGITPIYTVSCLGEIGITPA